MRYVLRHKRSRRRVIENYQRELTTAEMDGDLYYAYINDQGQVETGCVEHPAWHMVLPDSKARSHYSGIYLGEEKGELFLLYVCFEAMRNRYLLGAVYFFPGKQEEVICSASHGRLHYAPFELEGRLYLCARMRDVREEEKICLFRRENGHFLPVWAPDRPVSMTVRHQT